MNGTIGTVLGNPEVSLRFCRCEFEVARVGRLTITVEKVVDYDVLHFTAAVHDVLKMPTAFTVRGKVAGNGQFTLTASASIGPWRRSTNFGLCTAYVEGGVTFHATISGGANTLSIGAGADAFFGAGCGEVGGSVGASFYFGYTAPTTFRVTVSLRISFGRLGTWRPTLFDV